MLRFLPASTLIVCILLFPLFASSAFGNNSHRTNSDFLERVNAFRTDLEQAGFIVQEGEYSYQDAIALCNAGILDSCMGANVGAPYLAYRLLPAPGQKASNMKIDPTTGLAMFYHLRQDEAIVQIGFAPPEAGFLVIRDTS